MNEYVQGQNYRNFFKLAFWGVSYVINLRTEKLIVLSMLTTLVCALYTVTVTSLFVFPTLHLESPFKWGLVAFSVGLITFGLYGYIKWVNRMLFNGKDRIV